MQLSIIDNSGRVSLANEIEKSFQSASNIEIATAFIVSWSIRQLRDHLKNGRKEIRLLIGLFGRFNKQEDLKALLTLQKEFQGSLQVRISRNSKFHWKYYRFGGKKGFTVFIGSANFTREGMDKAGEIMAKFENNSSRGVIEDASKVFARQWEESESIKIEDFPISKYHEIKRIPRSDPDNPVDPQLTKLLKSPLFISTKSEMKNQTLKLHYVKVRNNVSSKTERIVDKFHSEWAKKGYDYFCYSGSRSFRRIKKGDYLLYQHWESNKWFFDIEKVVSLDDSIKTDDGKYFVAFEKQNSRSKTMYPEFEQLLESCGIKYKSSSVQDRTLGSRQAKDVLLKFGINLN